MKTSDFVMIIATIVIWAMIILFRLNEIENKLDEINDYNRWHHKIIMGVLK